jgi:amino acid adenylation domain-containing protein
VIAPPGPWSLPVEDLSAFPDPAAEAARRAAEDARTPFDLARGPVLRARLLRLGPEEHALLLTLHHIAGDGWSMDLLLGEMAALYRGFASGLPPLAAGLPELPLQYPDFARWQRRLAAAGRFERELAYWRTALAGLPPVLELPLDRPRPARQSFRGGEVVSLLPAALFAAVEERGRREGASPFMVLLAAFEALLARWSGQGDFAVGAPVAGRDRLETERLIGFFVNTLVLRARAAPERAFRDLLAEARRAVLEAHTHADLPFERLVTELAPVRDASHQPLFQVMLAMEETLRVPLPDLPRLVLTRLEVPEVAAKFDLTVAVTPRPDGSLRAAWSFASDLFDGATVARLATHFESLLAAAAADPGLALARLPLLSAAERHQLRAEWNDSAADWPLARCLHHLIEEQVGATPDAVALEMDGVRLSYRALDERANRLARRLRGLGVEPEERVAVLLRRGFDTVASVLAIFKAGGVYVPLSALHPRARLAAILGESEPVAVLTESALAGLVPPHGGHTLRLDEEAAALAALSGAPVPCKATPENLAYLIYTSGSTGEPKGVMIEHRHFVHFLYTTQDDIALGPGDVMPSWTTPTFDPSLLEWFAPLFAGARVLLIPEEKVLDMPALVDELRDATWLDGIPSIYRQIAAHLEEREGGAGWRHVRGITAGGESVPTDLLEALHRTFPVAELRNSYGPTETTILCTRFDASRHPPLRGDVIGRPMGNVVLRLLDPAGNPVPIGVKGEIYIGGAGVGRGYFRREAWTAERFVEVDGGRFFRTGDLARYLADGNLEFLGRIDHQVKIRGFRIELGEVEEALAGAPGVREVAVLAREHAGEKRLVAYVVPEPGAGPEAGSLRRRVAEQCPEYMVPAAFVFLPAMPRDANGKLDRRALPEPQGRPDLAAEYAAPRTELERTVAAVWAEVLGVERVGLDDNFFELGGNSLLIVRLRARLAAATGKELPVVELFRSPTVRALAERLEEETSPERAAEAVAAAGQARGQTRQESLAQLAELRRQRRRR